MQCLLKVAFMQESQSPSFNCFPTADEGFCSVAPKHAISLRRLPEHRNEALDLLPSLPVDFLAALAAQVVCLDSTSRSDSAADAAALRLKVDNLVAAPVPATFDLFERSFMKSADCRAALRAVSAQRLRLVELCLALPVWGVCRELDIVQVLNALQLSAHNVRDELVSALLLCCFHYDRSQQHASSAQLDVDGRVLPGLHGGDKWCEDLFHSLAAFCRVESNACIMACESVFYLVMRCLPQCRTHGSQRWCITAAANLCLTDNGRHLFVRPSFVQACDWLSRNALHAEVERWLATCIMNILYTKPPPRHIEAPAPPAVSRAIFETPDVRDMLIRTTHLCHSRITPLSTDLERDAIMQAITACFSALVNLAINCHLTEPERLDMCVTPGLLQLILTFSADGMSDDVVDMVAALMRIMAASEVCKRSFSCASVRDMFIRLLEKRTPAETKLKLLGALVLLFDNNPVPFADSVALFGGAVFRTAVLQSHTALSFSRRSDEIVGIFDGINTLSQR